MVQRNKFNQAVAWAATAVWVLLLVSAASAQAVRRLPVVEPVDQSDRIDSGFIRPTSFESSGSSQGPVNIAPATHPAPIEEAAGNASRRIVIGLPNTIIGHHGLLQIQPRVSVNGDHGSLPSLYDSRGTNTAGHRRFFSTSMEALGDEIAASPDGTPYDVIVDGEYIEGEYFEEGGFEYEGRPVGVQPLFGEVLNDVLHPCANECSPPGRLYTLISQPGTESGLGRERVAHALLEMDTSQPMNQLRVRFDAARDLEFPDRSGYYWAPTTIPETSVDYQDLRFLLEMGGGKFSTSTEIPLRILDPVNNKNTAGMGDMNVTTKTVLVDGKWLQITQVLRTQMNTGSSSRFLGTGFVSMEPGLLFRYKWSEVTYLHSEVKYWFPIAGDPVYSGEVLRYGFGWSHVWFENDALAIMPTMEIVGWSAMSGAKTNPNNGLPIDVDGEDIINFHPGMRIAVDAGGDLGLFELGIGGGVALTGQHFYRSIFRIDLRWTY